MYFTKENFPLLGVSIKMCSPCGFQSWNGIIFVIRDLIASLKGLCQMCVSKVLI
jgi:hypothetical protein